VAVLVPWRGGDPDRERAWAWLARWWADHYPTWPVLEGIPPEGPWCKAAAVAAALSMTDADVLVVADADVLVPGVGQAVQLVAGRSVSWAMPHKRVYRLTEAGTDRLIATGTPPPPSRGDPARGSTPSPIRLIAETHHGEMGGGCVILPADLYRQVPLDPRFVGYGQEDTSWGQALTVIAGPPWRESNPLWHLWHQPQQRLTRAIGSHDGLALYRRYRAARTPDQVLTLLGEFGHTTGLG